MSYDYSKLLGRVKEVCGSNAVFAERMNLSERSISLKLNGKVGWKQQEIENACGVLNIASDDIGLYFFNQIVHS